MLLLSRSAAYAVRTLVTIAPITSRIRNIPSEVPIGPEDGLPRRCVVNLDSITTVPKDALSHRLTALHATKVVAVNAAIKYALALP